LIENSSTHSLILTKAGKKKDNNYLFGLSAISEMSLATALNSGKQIDTIEEFIIYTITLEIICISEVYGDTIHLLFYFVCNFLQLDGFLMLFVYEWIIVFQECG
jgi:hypothetical protein